jgi:hypothetical protein
VVINNANEFVLFVVFILFLPYSNCRRFASVEVKPAACHSCWCCFAWVELSNY